VRIAAFDIDGTLLNSTGMDDRCYVRAVDDVFGVRDIDTDWSRHKYSTDSGIVHELVKADRGAPPSPGELEAFRACFERLVRAEAASRPESIRPVAGGRDFIARLRAQGWAVAVATGSWKCTARFKLRLAGLDPDDLPLADILRAAIGRAAMQAGAAQSLPAVYVGDGVWDFDAAERLGVGFVGVASNGNGGRLREAGVAALISDLTGGPTLVALLEQCARPCR
jgi:phosphoglycolate phosphatase-like HAD superfamily hydrolase